ncbi:MAG: T9SS type A sorting domain-containing protein [Paludibacteraceae bacterium]|nr:T9SS type A sorting domain-containing protein [Paludibacteraceae bacterium]
MKRTTSLILSCLCSLLLVQAQQIRVPFFCGFEDDAENALWTLNPGTDGAADRWVIGEATRSEGSRSLYISSNGGATPSFGNKPDVVYAYRIIRFPQGAGNYDISFDWKCMGSPSSGRLFVYIGLANKLNADLNLMQYAQADLSGNLTVLSSSSAIQYFARPKVNELDTGRLALYGSEAWENVSLTHKVSSGNSALDFVLLFAWVNMNVDEKNDNLSACIDNVQIASNNAKKPYALRVEPACGDSTMQIVWKSTQEWFEVQYKNVNSTVWRRQTHIQAVQDTVQSVFVNVPNGEEGSYDVRVRCANVEQTDTSAWATSYNQIYWCPDNHCVNFLDLHADNVVCTYGRHSAIGYILAGDTVGVRDFGEDSRASRHTVNWRKGVVDARTKGSTDFYGNPVPPLKTIPDGSVASVRLGNWEAMMGQEDITYSFVVDSVEQAMLFVRYAVVLQTPEPGGASGFMLSVLDENGNLIDPECGVARFIYSDELEEQWNSSYVDMAGREQPTRQAIWKDWTSLGYNMAPYHGRTVSVRFHSRDCLGGAHYGYGYFTLDCVSSHLKSDNCGAGEYMDIAAPEGFNYSWTNSKGADLGHERVLHTKADHDVYRCTVCMLPDPADPTTADKCCFDLSTEMAMRYAYPDYVAEWQPAGCKNTLRLTDRSHIVMRDDKGFEQHTAESCDEAEWELTRAADPVPVVTQARSVDVVCPPEGDTVYVRLTASIGAAHCSEEMFDTVVVGGILTPPVERFDTICENQIPYIFNGEVYDRPGRWELHYTNFAGCDSLLVYNLAVNLHSGPDTVEAVTCSSALPYYFNGIPYSRQGTYRQRLTNRLGCDSLIDLRLVVFDKLEVQLDTVPTALCADEGPLVINYAVLSGRFDSLFIRFDDAARAAGFTDRLVTDNTSTAAVWPLPAGVRPGAYQVVLDFVQPSTCGNQTYTLGFVINYASSLITQRWNDVLAIRNADYNGGYTFSAYQWYKDGTPIDGATMPYLYVSGGLDNTAEYSARLVRADDGAELFVCPVVPEYFDTEQNIPTLLHVSQQIGMRTAGRALWTDLAGRVLAVQDFTEQTPVTVPALHEGYYLLSLITADGTRTEKVLVTDAVR